MDARSILSTYGVKIINPKTVAYDFHAISSLFHLAFYIHAFAPFELSAPITITHCPGPGGVRFIKHSYYFKPISKLFSYGGPLTSARMAHRILLNQYLFATHLVEVDNLNGTGHGT